MTDPLQVFVEGQQSGILLKEEGEFLFNYSENTSPEQFISLTMPVRAKGYVHPQLHPFFEMSLPEGYLLAVIKKHFAKLVATDDLGLLHILAPGVEGRVHYREKLHTGRPLLRLDQLLHPESGELFGELVERFALQSAVSGVQPKVLAQLQEKATLKLGHYIVKSWGEDYPQLALNEYYCMQAFRLADIDVPPFYLSDDDRLFIMKRFDIAEDGTTLGFEDMCVLQAKQRDHKYQGSYEQIAKSIKIFTSPPNKAESLRQLFKMVVLNTCLQNGDAHLMNFGVIYKDASSVRIAPAYDVVSTTAYIRNDIPALTLLGSKKWWDYAGLVRFGMESCQMSRKQIKENYQQCTDALQQTHQQLQLRLRKEKVEEKRSLLEHLSGLMVSYQN
ncbi:MAG: type II toxin-antitoxin system HipA family toxin [Gammaproteobacteria bacterium]|mgnify:CR=1 FL=1|nr:type II toxin-antitoxin system HipA family toxin [Gammaproteobacteria bacterium]